jgi:hypothetical protein
MSDIPSKILVKQLKNLLQEGIQGPQKEWSYFTDPGSNGFLGTTGELNSTSASKTSGPNDNSVASHTWHLCFALNATSDWIQGKKSSHEWEKSWRIQKVNDRDWSELQSKLRQEYEEFYHLIETVDLSDEKVIGGVIGTIAHIAYHLGAIRQKLTNSEL